MSNVDVRFERAILMVAELQEFYTERQAWYWLISPQAPLTGRCPIDMLADDELYEVVRGVIERLRDSAYI